MWLWALQASRRGGGIGGGGGGGVWGGAVSSLSLWSLLRPYLHNFEVDWPKGNFA